MFQDQITITLSTFIHKKAKVEVLSYIFKLLQAFKLIILIFSIIIDFLKMKYVYSHDLSHTKTTDWIILDVRQSYFSLYFIVVVTIVDRPCDSMYGHLFRGL